MDYGPWHVQFGWWSLLAFTALGLLLEAFHAFKVSAYLDVANDTRRLMWTLAHAHGTLLSLVHVLFGLTLQGRGDASRSPQLRATSLCLVAATILLPAGFFAGGFGFFGGDPGAAALFMIPVGAMLLLIAIAQIARLTRRNQAASGADRGAAPSSKARRP